MKRKEEQVEQETGTNSIYIIPVSGSFLNRFNSYANIKIIIVIIKNKNIYKLTISLYDCSRY